MTLKIDHLDASKHQKCACMSVISKGFTLPLGKVINTAIVSLALVDMNAQHYTSQKTIFTLITLEFVLILMAVMLK